MQFSNPTFLWGLLGLFIPIGIHLLNRREGKIIKIGSIRHLNDTDTTQFKSIRLNEVLLLVLRCLLITAFVFILSGIYLPHTTRKENWLLIERGLERDNEFQTLVDSLKRTGFKIKWLSTGFPDISEPAPILKKNNYWELVNDLKSTPLENVLILSFNYLKGFSGKRPPLPENIRWISKNSAALNFTLFVRKTAGDSILIRTGTSTSKATLFSSKEFSSSDPYNDTLTIEPPDTLKLVVVYDSSFSNAERILQAALMVLEEKSKILFEIESVSPEDFEGDIDKDWIFWITSTPVKRSIKTNLIYFREDPYSNVLFQLDGQNHEHSFWRLTKRLTQEIALENNFVAELGRVILPKHYLSRALDFDRRVVPDQISWADEKPSAKLKNTTNPSSDRDMMAWIFLLLLVGERVIAFKRSQ